MKKHILLFTSLILCTFFSIQEAKAETTYCPAGTILYKVPDSNEILCITKEYLSSTDLATKSAFYMQIGLGYFAPEAAVLPIRFGYDFGTFGAEKSVGFSLNTEASFQAGSLPTFSFAFSVVPVIYTYYSRFRFSAGLGLGLYYHDPSYNDYKEDDMSSDKSCYFALTPEFSFDWFLNDSLWLGFSLRVMINVFLDYRDFYDKMYYTRYEFYKVSYFPQIEAFHVGYKF